MQLSQFKSIEKVLLLKAILLNNINNQPYINFKQIINNFKNIDILYYCHLQTLQHNNNNIYSENYY